MIIDFHTHSFPSKISVRAMEGMSVNGHVAYFTDANFDALNKEMEESGVTYCVNLPVMTKPEQVSHVNDSLISQRDELFKRGIITFGGMHPDFADGCTDKKALTDEINKLKDAGIKGIKIHPAFQGKHINDIAFKRMIGAISGAGLITITHAGMDAGFMDDNYASPEELLDVIDDVRPEKFVLAHMGGWQSWDGVEKYIAGANVYLDTAYSFGKVMIRDGEDDMMPYKYNLDHESFARLARAHGIDKILFATDSPWVKQSEYVKFLKEAPLSEEEKKKIFYDNAAKLLAKN